MKVILDGETYTIQVKDIYMNDKKEFIESILTLEEWVIMVGKKAISALYLIEEALAKEFGREIKLSIDLPDGRKPILNLSGCISRLPENLIIVKE